MPEENPNPDPAPKGGEEFIPITSQEQLNRIIGQRINDVRSQYADYDDLKAKAGEVPTLTERLSQAEAEVPTKVASTLRDALISLGVVSEARKVLLTANEPTALMEQVKAIRDLDQPSGRRTATPPGKPAPGEGEKGRAAAALRALRQG